MSNLPLKYKGYCIALQEVPNEISLTISISGCPHKCEGCHSKYLWEYDGNYITDDLPYLINKYQEYISCVCFMGGDQNMNELAALCNYAHTRGYKCCLYTGLDDFPTDMPDFDYIKTGHYDQNKGGLNSPTTNQRMYKRTSNGYVDITYLFQKGGLNAEDN